MYWSPIYYELMSDTWSISNQNMFFFHVSSLETRWKRAFICNSLFVSVLREHEGMKAVGVNNNVNDNANLNDNANENYNF